MSHVIRRLPRDRALLPARRPLRWFKPWYEWIAVLATTALACTRIRMEMGSWLALFASAGAPLAVLDGHWPGRLVAHRIRQWVGEALGRMLQIERESGLWSSSTPLGVGVVISRIAGGSIVLTIPAPLGDGSPVPFHGRPMLGRSQHCVLFAVDIAQFTHAGRDDEVQLALREALYRLLVESFEGSGISWRSCVHEDRGDGVVVVIPAHMPTITVIDPLVAQIQLRLRRYNRLSSPVAQVRLRVAVHIGEVYRDGHGLAGKAVNELFRMLDAPDLRQAVQVSETGLAVIVSDYLYQSVIDGGPGNTDPAAYSEVLVRVKQFQARAWLQIPG